MNHSDLRVRDREDNLETYSSVWIRTMPPVNAPNPVSKSDILALLYQRILTGIVRIQAGRQALGDLEVFRRRMKAALQEAEKEAMRAGYGPAEIREAEFAVVAFLDETILSSKEA